MVVEVDMMPDVANPPKASWADDVDDFDEPRIEVSVDANGLKTVIEYKTNDEGKKVKVTRKIKRVLIKEKVNHAVAERKKWAKFGAEAGKKAGLDSSTTTIAEQINLRLSAGGSKAHREQEQEQEDQAKLKAQLANTRINCRICKGDHYTAKCPYKGTLQPLEELTATLGDAGSGNATPDRFDSPTIGDGGTERSKYIAPALRDGGKRGGETMFSRDKRDDTATLRVTNLSEEVTEGDLHELFRKFGSIARVYLARDRETNLCKGFAFISFHDREDAARAMGVLDGYGYDNLILHVEFSKPRES